MNYVIELIKKRASVRKFSDGVLSRTAAAGEQKKHQRRLF